jgi:hypothetical protein
VLADQHQGSVAGVAGTPAFFINGALVSGALPFGSFKAAIDQEMVKAKKLVASGTPPARVYEAIMKKAYAGVVEASRAAKTPKVAVGHQGRRP